MISAFDLPDHLPRTDVLISLLPATEQTRHAVDAGVLALLPSRAWVVNVGRGATLDEAALLDALRSDRLAGAALDVFETEPLPADSPLWDEPRVLISPHAAGGRPRGAGELVAANLAAFLPVAAPQRRRALEAAPARAGLAPRASERGPVRERLPHDRRAAPGARLALAPVDVQRALEVPAGAVDVDVERVEARAARRQRVAHDVGGGVSSSRTSARSSVSVGRS